ncbi:MAG: hypothetical protein ABR600_03405 [Actinomycetota bacterium]
MTALDREGWILTGFALLFFAALVVSVCGWLLVWRTRRPKDAPVTPEEDTAPEEDATPVLPPANPLR